MRILIIDDSRLMRNAIRKNLSEAIADAEFVEAADGVEGLAAMQSGQFAVALVDWNMPRKTGIDMIREVRAFDRRTPMIMVTTEAEKHRVVEAIRAGANNYVVKPFEAAQLISKVVETVRKVKDTAAIAAA